MCLASTQSYERVPACRKTTRVPSSFTPLLWRGARRGAAVLMIMVIVVLLRWGGSWGEGLIRDGALSDIDFMTMSAPVPE